MKTVLQELIEELNREIDNCERNGLQYRGIYLDARWKAENLLEKEKQQLANAYDKGQKDFANYDPERHGNKCKNGNQYYDSTFGYKVGEAGI